MTVNDYLSAILIGLVVGVLGRLVLPGRQPIGLFVTFVIGVIAALLGTLAARAFHVENNATVHLWKLHWSWVQLGIQVLFAAIGIGLANALTYTKLATRDSKPRRRTRRRS